MYEIVHYNSFNKDIKRCKKRNLDFDALKKVVDELSEKGKLPPIYKPHKLSGNYNRSWECHIKPDWLLIWRQDDKNKTIYLDRTGTHSDLF